MKVKAEVSQLNGSFGGTFFNLLDDNRTSLIGIWGCFAESTYLVKVSSSDDTWYFIQAENQLQLIDYFKDIHPTIKYEIIGTVKELFDNFKKK